MDFYRTLPFADGSFTTCPKITEPVRLNGATFFPVHDKELVPLGLLRVMHGAHIFAVEEGLSYPYHEPLTFDKFVDTWFTHFAAVLVEGTWNCLGDLLGKTDEWWETYFCGTFYIRPNFAGRCSHVCNGGFIIPFAKRGQGIGRVLGRQYLRWAPQLGYAYSMFNLVFETNTASIKIWDSLGFDRIGYIKNAAVLKGHGFVGAIQFGKDLLVT